MKEQDAARSFVDGMKCKCGGEIIMFTSDLDICKKCGKTFEPRSEPTQAELMSELTRLRSELQQKDEVINELVEAVEKLLRVDSFRGDFPYTTKVFESVIQKSKAK